MEVLQSILRDFIKFVKISSGFTGFQAISNHFKESLTIYRDSTIFEKIYGMVFKGFQNFLIHHDQFLKILTFSKVFKIILRDFVGVQKNLWGRANPNLIL